MFTLRYNSHLNGLATRRCRPGEPGRGQVFDPVPRVADCPALETSVLITVCCHMNGVETRPGDLVEDRPVLPAWFQCRVVRECGGEIEDTNRTGWNSYVRDVQGAGSGAVAVVALDCDTEQTSGTCRDTKVDRAERVPARVAARSEGGRRPPVAARREAADLRGSDARALVAIEALVAAPVFRWCSAARPAPQSR